jgi:hypothetical protein
MEENMKYVVTVPNGKLLRCKDESYAIKIAKLNFTEAYSIDEEGKTKQIWSSVKK